MKKLEERLQDELPGVQAQSEMAPYSRPLRFNEEVIQKARKGGVLVLFYPENEEICFPLMRRMPYEGVHSRQVSFPGGRYEEQDKDLIQTALREAEEEMGIIQQEVKVIGQLSRLYIPPSNFLVSPTVAYVDAKPKFIPEAKEVEEIIETSLEYLLQDGVRKSKQMKLSDKAVFDTPYFDVNGNVVWGATAMMLSELMAVVKRIY